MGGRASSSARSTSSPADGKSTSSNKAIVTALKEIQPPVVDALTKKLQGSGGGAVLDMSMGLGKTCSVLSYLAAQVAAKRTTEILVFVPTLAILKGSWVDDMKQSDRCWADDTTKPGGPLGDPKKYVQYGTASGGGGTMTVALVSEFMKIAGEMGQKTGTRIVVFDEIHMLWDAFSGRGQAQGFLDRLDALLPDQVIGMTGTIVSDSFRDFLMTMNVVIREKESRPSLSLSAFERNYFKVPYYRTLQAWLVPFVTTPIITIISPLFLLEVADVYLSADPVIPYKKHKVRIVQSVLRRVPLFQTRVFDDSITDILKSSNPMVYLSKLVYNTLISPFGFLIPVIAFNIAARSRSDITTPNMAKIQKDFQKYTVTRRVEYRKSAKDTQNTFWKTPVAPYDVLYPRMLIKRRTVPYSLHQAKMFVRFCLGRLGDEEYGRLVGSREDKKEAELATDRTSFQHLQDVGLNIGNQTDESSSNPKFQYILQKILDYRERKNEEEEGVLRVVIYSRFSNTRDGFENYVKQKLEGNGIQFYTKQEGEGGVEAYSNREEEKRGIRVLFLTGKDHTGLDGVRETNLMFIAEPLASYGELLQLRARVARVKSHEEPRNSLVTVYELACVTDWRSKAARWWESVKNLERDVHYSLRKQMFSQIATPDEVVLKRQQIKQAFIDSLSF
jgi:hypothetical protein